MFRMVLSMIKTKLHAAIHDFGNRKPQRLSLCGLVEVITVFLSQRLFPRLNITILWFPCKTRKNSSEHIFRRNMTK